MPRIFFIIGFLFTTPTYGDVFDRIDACENNGGGSCVFNLLRELARSGGSGGQDSINLKEGTFERVSNNTNFCPTQFATPGYRGSVLVYVDVECTNPDVGWSERFNCSGSGYCVGDIFSLVVDSPGGYTMTNKQTTSSANFRWKN